jgi:hypothetical protein
MIWSLSSATRSKQLGVTHHRESLRRLGFLLGTVSDPGPWTKRDSHCTNCASSVPALLCPLARLCSALHCTTTHLLFPIVPSFIIESNLCIRAITSCLEFASTVSLEAAIFTSPGLVTSKQRLRQTDLQPLESRLLRPLPSDSHRLRLSNLLPRPRSRPPHSLQIPVRLV